jgi:hypothetical protein
MNMAKYDKVLLCVTMSFSFLMLPPALLLFLYLISLGFLCLAGRAICTTALSLRLGFLTIFYPGEQQTKGFL